MTSLTKGTFLEVTVYVLRVILMMVNHLNARHAIILVLLAMEVQQIIVYHAIHFSSGIFMMGNAYANLLILIPECPYALIAILVVKHV